MSGPAGSENEGSGNETSGNEASGNEASANAGSESEGGGREVGGSRAAAGAKRLMGGDLRAAVWAVAAMVIATLGIFLAQRLHANSGQQPSARGPAPSAAPSPSPSGPPGCTASFVVAGAWPTGFQGNVTVRSTGTAAISGWTVSWAFPSDQTVMQLWNGHYTQTKTAVRVESEGWNGSPGTTSATFGFVGSGSAPTGLNNLTCTVSLATVRPSPQQPSPSRS